jgi:hypothetical protein
MLVVSLERTEQHSGAPAQQPREEEEVGPACRNRSPERQHQHELEDQAPAPAQVPLPFRVMRQVPVAPERLGHAEQQAQVRGERPVQGARAEERQMDEVVSDCIGIPPERKRDHRCGRRRQQKRAVQERQQHEQPVAPGMTQDVYGHCTRNDALAG